MIHMPVMKQRAANYRICKTMNSCRITQWGRCIERWSNPTSYPAAISGRPGPDMAGYKNLAGFRPGPGPDMIFGATLVIFHNWPNRAYVTKASTSNEYHEKQTCDKSKWLWQHHNAWRFPSTDGICMLIEAPYISLAKLITCCYENFQNCGPGARPAVISTWCSHVSIYQFIIGTHDHYITETINYLWQQLPI